VVWPSNPDVSKHHYGVDGVLVFTSAHDRTDYWTNQVDGNALSQAKSLACVHYYDPVNMVLTDLPILEKTIGDIAQLIKTIVG
jgi:hypothetical protein